MISPNELQVSADQQSNTTVASINYMIRWQKITRLFIHPVRLLLSRGIDMQLQPNDFEPGTSYVVASNHQSQLDSFVLIESFPEAVFAKLRPFRAMTHNGVMKRGPVYFYLRKMGCFPSKSHAQMPHGIEFASELVNSGQTVFICPEGWLTKPGGLPARNGVAILARKQNVKIIPAHIQWTNYGRYARTFKLVVGRPFDAHHLSAQEILDNIYSLPLPK